MNCFSKKNIMTWLVVALVAGISAGAMAQDSITIENGEITIESDDGQQVIMLDTDRMGKILSETLEISRDGLQDVLAELDEMQLEIKLGNDNQLSLATREQMWEVNLDVIFDELGSVLETAFDDLDTDDWAGHYSFEDEDNNEEELEAELDRLKDELKELRRELQYLKEI